MLRQLLQKLVRRYPAAARRARSALPGWLEEVLAPLVYPLAVGRRGGGQVLRVPLDAAVVPEDGVALSVDELAASIEGAARRRPNGTEPVDVAQSLGVPSERSTALRSDGAAGEGTAVDGSVVDGSVVDGSVVDGSVVDGSVVDGSVVDGSVVDGSVVEEAAARGAALRGAAVDVPLVSVVIPTWNNRELCAICLAALWRNTRWPRWEVILVDNGSSDGSAELLRQQALRDARLRPLWLGSNLGFAAACNRAVAAARGQVLVLLNDDTVVGPGWLPALAGHLERDPRLGLVCPRTNEAPGPARLETRYQTLEEMEALSRELRRERGGRSFEVERVTLFCGALRRSVFESVGGLDERYEVGLFEDDDLCRALRAAGYRVAVAEDAFVHHVGHASFARLTDQRYLELWEANKRRYERKWGERWRPPRDPRSRRGIGSAVDAVGAVGAAGSSAAGSSGAEPSGAGASAVGARPR